MRSKQYLFSLGLELLLFENPPLLTLLPLAQLTLYVLGVASGVFCPLCPTGQDESGPVLFRFTILSVLLMAATGYVFQRFFTMQSLERGIAPKCRDVSSTPETACRTVMAVQHLLMGAIGAPAFGYGVEHIVQRRLGAADSGNT